MWNWSRYPVTSILENNLQSKEMNALHCTDFNRTSYLITSAVLVSTKFSGEKMGQLFIQRTTSKMQQTSIYDINPPTSLRVNIEVRGDPGEAGTLVHSHRPQSDLAHQSTEHRAGRALHHEPGLGQPEAGVGVLGPGPAQTRHLAPAPGVWPPPLLHLVSHLVDSDHRHTVSEGGVQQHLAELVDKAAPLDSCPHIRIIPDDPGHTVNYHKTDVIVILYEVLKLRANNREQMVDIPHLVDKDLVPDFRTLSRGHHLVQPHGGESGLCHDVHNFLSSGGCLHTELKAELSLPGA